MNREARIMDTDLAMILGYARPIQLRTIIKRNRIELEARGDLILKEFDQITSHGRHHAAQVFYLNKRQAFFLANRSRTPAGRALASWQADVALIFDEALEEGRIVLDEETKAGLAIANETSETVFSEALRDWKKDCFGPRFNGLARHTPRKPYMNPRDRALSEDAAIEGVKYLGTEGYLESIGFYEQQEASRATRQKKRGEA